MFWIKKYNLDCESFDFYLDLGKKILYMFLIFMNLAMNRSALSLAIWVTLDNSDMQISGYALKN